VAYGEGGSENSSLSFVFVIFCSEDPSPNHGFDEIVGARRFDVVWRIEEERQGRRSIGEQSPNAEGSISKDSKRIIIFPDPCSLWHGSLAIVNHPA